MFVRLFLMSYTLEEGASNRGIASWGGGSWVDMCMFSNLTLSLQHHTYFIDRIDSSLYSRCDPDDLSILSVFISNYSHLFQRKSLNEKNRQTSSIVKKIAIEIN